MRQVPPRAWLAAALAALIAGCRHADGPAELPDMPGQTPPSFRVREAPDGNGVVMPMTPPPRKIHPAGHVPAAQPTHAIVSAVRWQEAPAQPPARLDAPRPLTPRRVSVSDAVLFAHAVDHRWLIGSLIHEPQRRRWSLRYANPGEPDVYGGELELLETGPPAFRVRSLQALASGGR
jgi:hypothetical protein